MYKYKVFYCRISDLQERLNNEASFGWKAVSISFDNEGRVDVVMEVKE